MATLHTKKVKVTTKKINANFSVEMYNDLMAYRGLDVEEEMRKLQKQIIREERKKKIERLNKISEQEE